ncbi:MAG: FG-GAP repeat domain-containing protein, partial [Verrucomicrobiales bacterium]
DILCGNTAGHIGIFENLGLTDKGITWAKPVLLEDQDGVFRVMAGPNGSVQGPCEAKWGYTTLSVADWDGDQDADILYNSIWAQLGLLKNDAGKLTRTVPASAARTQWRTTPVAIDFDQDGTLDLVA